MNTKTTTMIRERLDQEGTLVLFGRVGFSDAWMLRRTWSNKLDGFATAHVLPPRPCSCGKPHKGDNKLRSVVLVKLGDADFFAVCAAERTESEEATLLQ